MPRRVVRMGYRLRAEWMMSSGPMQDSFWNQTLRSELEKVECAILLTFSTFQDPSGWLVKTDREPSDDAHASTRPSS